MAVQFFQTSSKYYILDDLKDYKYICIVDDLITRGATISEIIRAIRTSNQVSIIFGVVLGKTENINYANHIGIEINNNHVPEEYAEIWDSKLLM
ncbi:phosphoribosyltransferase [Desulforegula conservatrix]|uniref:phosphoribosyltransferase n=1 Tax=Desulforegula conservatrix TaxID=153026 RepID=UPI0003F9B532|nr:phosphoribosyltransferase [Desulforegula conservatrix]